MSQSRQGGQLGGRFDDGVRAPRVDKIDNITQII
jgi:hypothetical protein